MMTPGQQTILQQIADDVRRIEAKIDRVSGESLVLRSRMKRAEEDISGVVTLTDSHEKKINFALGGSMVVGALAGYLATIWDALRGKH